MRKRLKDLTAFVERKTSSELIAKERMAKHFRMTFRSGDRTAVVVVSGTPSDALAAHHRVVSDVRRQLA